MKQPRMDENSDVYHGRVDDYISSLLVSNKELIAETRQLVSVVADTNKTLLSKLQLVGSKQKIKKTEIEWEPFNLPLYAGERNTDVIEEWIYKMEAFFYSSGKKEEQMLVYAANNLTGLAHLWWRSVQGKPISKWNDFKSLLRQSFSPPNEREKILSDWKELQQKDSPLKDYEEQFLKLYFKFPDLPEQSKIDRYVDGLREDIRVDVRVFCPKALQEAMRLAALFEKPIEEPEPNAEENTLPHLDGIHQICEGPANGDKETEEQCNATHTCDIMPAKEQSLEHVQHSTSADSSSGGSSEDSSSKNFAGSSKESSSEGLEEDGQTDAQEYKLQKQVEVKRCYVMYCGEDDYHSWMKGKVKGKDVSIVFTNNSSHNFVSSRLVERLQLRTVECKPFILESYGHLGGTIYTRMVPDLTYGLGSAVTDQMDFYVIDLSRNDMLFGWPWILKIHTSTFHTHNGTRFHGFPWKGRKVEMPLYTGRPPFM